MFIVDNGEAGIWVWCGRRASKQEKREGMANASVSYHLLNSSHVCYCFSRATFTFRSLQAFIQQRNYSNHVQMVKVHESAETTEFKALFKVWEKEKLPGQPAYQHNKIGSFCYIIHESFTKYLILF